MKAIKQYAAIPWNAAGDWLFNRRIYAKLRRREHVLCIGDSHVRVMRHVRHPRVWFRTVSVEGATASGVMNPNGTAQAIPIFTKRLMRARTWQSVLVQLGEVDCGFVIWHRAARRDLSVTEQLVHTLNTYSAFISKIVAMGFRDICVLSAPAPTIGDDPIDWGHVANLRSEVSASISDRTVLTLRFNSEMQQRCSELGASFIDATTGHIDPTTGLVHPEFLRDTPEDHHLADFPYAALILRELFATTTAES